MRIVMRSALLLLLFLSGCAAPGPSFGTVAGALPPVPPGKARIYVYRWLEPYETLAQTTMFLNGAPAGVTAPGSVLYRDVEPGQYTIAVESRGIYPDQDKTVVLRAGQTVYARVESLRSWSACRMQTGCWDTFVVMLVDPAVARAEMGDLRFVSG